MENSSVMSITSKIAAASILTGTIGAGYLAFTSTGNLKLAFGAAAIGLATTSVAAFSGFAGGQATQKQNESDTALINEANETLKMANQVLARTERRSAAPL